MMRRASMLRSLARQAQTQQPRVQRASTALVASRPANCRSLTTTRARLAAEKPPAGEAGEAGRPQDALVLTPYEKVTATAQGGFWIGLLGLGAVGMYFVIKELMPNRMSPNGLFSESLDIVSENSEVTSRLGTPLHGYGQDRNRHREGRRNFVEHVNLKDKDGNPRLRVKYNVKGPAGGHGLVFAEVNHDMKKGEYVYLIVQITKSGEVIKIIDNRQILAAESKEEQDALRQLLGGK